MTFSFILATCGRVKEVENFLNSLVEASNEVQDAAIELIVADQNDDDRLSCIISKVPPSWRIIHEKIHPKGVSLARNKVLWMATGEIVAFPDDDCLYEKYTLFEVGRAFAKGIDVAVAIDTAREHCEGNATRRLSKYSVFRHGEMYLQFYRRDILGRIGQFDEDFGPGENSRFPYGGDDSDYLARSALAGLCVYRVPAIKVWHPPQDASHVSKAKTFGYGRTRMALLGKLKYPFWFKCANIAYPLVCILWRPAKAGYYLAMLAGRIFGIMGIRKQ